MKRFFGRKDGDNILICDDEYNHLKNVLRIKVGDEVIVSLNTSKEYVCEVISLGKNAVCKINGENECLVNPKKDITIGNHVWIGAHANVLKGVTLYDGSIVGFGSVLTKNVPPRCVAAGNPAVVVKKDVLWER